MNLESTDIAVRCRGLVNRYSDVTAVDGHDLEVRRGECFGLLGPNGAGKTTTIEILEGLTDPDAGEVEILGTTWAKDADALRERLGISLQETRLAEKLTVGETIRLFSAPSTATGATRRRSSAGSPSTRSAAPASASCRAGRSSGWRSPAPWWGTRTSSSSTSRRPASIRRAASSSGRS